MNVVDSSAWLEYFADGPNAATFARPIEAVAKLVVPTLSLYEVFKRVFVLRGERAGLEAAAMMRQGMQANLTDSIALEAARLSLEHRLPMADSVILATARAHGATLWTQDADFADIAGVRYVAKGTPRVNEPGTPPYAGRTAPRPRTQSPKRTPRPRS